MSIDYPRFWRVIDRSMELVRQHDVIAIVKTVWDAKVAAAAARYVAAHRALEDAEKARKKERDEALTALAEIERPYKEARTALEQFVEELAVPKSLKSRRTATDKRAAIARVFELIELHKATEQWANDLASGPFGTLAPIAIREIDEWIQSDGDIEKAVRERAAAYEAAYPPFLGFRQQVGASYGESSIHYRRLVVRSSGKLEVDDVDDEDTDTDDTDPTDTDPVGPTT